MGMTPAGESLDVTASLDPHTGHVDGTLTWTLPSPANVPVHELLLFRYPDLYAVDPKLGDILHERVYPVGFDPGGQELGEVVVQLGTERLLVTPEEIEREGVPLIRIPLEPPLLPGEAASITGSFHTKIPRKFGTFGRYRGVVTVNGGLAPMPVDLRPDGTWALRSPPATTHRSLALNLPEGHRVLIGGHSPDADASRFVPDARRPGQLHIQRVGAARIQATWSDPASRWISLSIRRAPTLRENLPLDQDGTLSWTGQPLRRIQKRWLRRAADGARATARAAGLEPADLVLVEAPLRRNLVERGEGVLYVSDRFFEADLPVWRYHDLHLARAILAEAVEASARPREPTRAEPLTTHGLAWRLIPAYLKTRWREHINLRQLLDGLSFLPEVDAILQTPVFPFADQIFDNPWVVDPLRADVRRFNRPLRTGRALLLELEDRVGRQSLDAAVDAWLDSTTPDFFTFLQDRTGQPAVALAEAWMGGWARVNLAVEAVERQRQADGYWRTRVTIRREVLEGDPTGQHVEVRLDPVLGKKGRATLIWDGQDEVASWEVVTRKRVGSVQVDPRGRILETDADGISLKKDNRFPRRVKLTGSAFLIAADSASGIEAYAYLGLRPAHDLQHQVRLRVWTDEEAWVGGGPSYRHYFGPQRIGSYRQHRIDVSVDLQWLNQIFRPTNAPMLVNGQVSWTWDTRGSAFSPSRGGWVQVAAFAGRDFALEGDALRTAEESAFAGVDLQATKLFPLHPWHVLALRGKVGIVGGNVKHRQFVLGGNANVRGYPANFLLGKFRTMGSVEWRHFFLRDLDLPGPLMRYRALQGVLFVEGGVVARDLETPPEPSDLGVSIGYALRVYLDWAGVLPAMGGIEFAFSPNAPAGRLPFFSPPETWLDVPFQIYFVASQSF